MLATSNYRDIYVPAIWRELIYQAAVADCIEQNAQIMRQTAAIASTDQGCILTFLTTLAKFTSCTCITYTWFQPCLAVIQIMLVKLQCIIPSISVATEHFHVG